MREPDPQTIIVCTERQSGIEVGCIGPPASDHSSVKIQQPGVISSYPEGDSVTSAYRCSRRPRGCIGPSGGGGACRRKWEVNSRERSTSAAVAPFLNSWRSLALWLNTI